MEVLDRMPKEHVAVVGHSEGGLMAMQAAADGRKQIAAVVLLGLSLLAPSVDATSQPVAGAPLSVSRPW